MPASLLSRVLPFASAALWLLSAGQPPVSAAREGGTLLFDNARVTVWDVISPTETRGSVPRSPWDTVSIALTGGPLRVVDLAGAEQTLDRRIGDVRFELKGDGHRELPAGGAAPRDIVIDLKDARVPPLPNPTRYPNAFPRPGSKKVLDNDRVVAWDYTWTPGVATPMHFHDKDVVVTYLETGELASTAPDGQVVNNPHYFGFTKFNTRDRAHTETLVKGRGRAIIVELK
jgi:hypothetical protein